MPKASAYDIPHVSITEHFIQKKPAPHKVSKADIAESEWEKQKDFLKLVCLTNENPEPYNTALAYLNYYEKYVQNPLLLDSAKAYLSKCNDLDLWIRYHYLQKDYASIIKIASDSLSDAWTNYRISEAYYNKQRVQIAIKYLRKSVSKDKHNIDFRNRLTTLLIEDNKVDEAYKVALLTMSLNSSNAEANNLLGFCLVIKGELNGSEQYFLQANYLNPDDIKPIENLASLYLNTGDKIKSKKYIDKLIKLNPNSLNYKKLNNVWKLL